MLPGSERSPGPALRVAQALVFGAGVVSHLALLFQVFHPKGLTTMALVFPAVLLAPWALLLVCSRLARGRRLASMVVLGLAALYLVLGCWSYWDTIYVHPDPQGGLIFIVMPVLGGLAALVLLAGLRLSRPS